MGANLRPRVRNFQISTETFNAGDHSIEDGCVTVGIHRVLRFDLLTENIGNTDFVVGSPADHPEWFVLSASHGHYHLIDFNEYILYDRFGNEVTKGYKQAFCTIDLEALPGTTTPAKFTDCNVNQGISAGWADIYGSHLACQFIVIDGVADGDYILKTTTNAKRIVPEDDYSDNTICTGLRIASSSVSIVDPPLTVTLKTLTLNFTQIPEGETTVRAVVFDVIACQTVHFEITAIHQLSGPISVNFHTPLGTTTISAHWNFLSPSVARLWIAATAPVAGGTATGEVDIHCTETGEDFTIPISLNAIARPKSATVLVLDKSGSMDSDSGDGRKRIDVLHASAPPFIDLVWENSAVGMVSFDHDAYDLLPMTVMGRRDDNFDPSRITAKAAIQAHNTNPAGFTAIGDGCEKASNLLNTVNGYDVEAIVVLTDGFETAAKYISDVQPLINGNQHIYAIGLGTAQEVQPTALNALCNGHNGYLLMTGTIDTSNYFRLAKYYLQILTGISNSNIILDPDGFIQPGQKHRIPFRITEADITSDIILLCPYPDAIEMLLETPDGTIIDKSMSGTVFGITYHQGQQISYFGLTLPTNINGKEYREGIWNAVLTIKASAFKRYISSLDNYREQMEIAKAHGVRYSLNVHTYSNLRMKAMLSQNSNQPGATLTLRSVLTEYNIPVETRASVQAEMTRPDNSHSTLSLTEIEPGIFEAATPSTIPGIYHFRIFANGHTLRGMPFTREQLLTGAVWQGGDQPPIKPGDTKGKPIGNRGLEQCCKIMVRYAFIVCMALLGKSLIGKKTKKTS